ncbi:hypothetical protein L7F22_060644 [Adiantum nelumboides]|nr:hypothetical protein [Adiantum nelumboides]
MALHEALWNGFGGIDNLGLQSAATSPSRRQQAFPGGLSEKSPLNTGVSSGSLKVLLQEGFNLSPGLLHNMGLAPSYASAMKDPFSGHNPLSRHGHAAESSTLLFPFASKLPDSIPSFCFGNEELGKDHAWQHVSPDFSLNIMNEPPHSPNSVKAHSKDVNTEANPECVTILATELEYWYKKLQQRMVIGLCHSIKPSLESLKAWVVQQWSNKNLRVEQVQYLPNNQYMFLFEDPGFALQVVDHGQWLIRNTSLTAFSWYPRFNPRGPKPTRIPTWVDFPGLPIELYPWLSLLEPGLEGSWARDPEEDSSSSGIPSFSLNQKIISKNLPNACFHYFKQGHLIKDCPNLKSTENPKASEKEEGFETVTRKNSSRSGKNPRQSPHWNKHNYNPLLESVFEPFFHLSEEFTEEQGPKEDGPAYHPKKPLPTTPSDNPGQFKYNGDMALDSPVVRTRMNSSSSDSEDETIHNTQKDKVHFQSNPSFEEQLEIHDPEEKDDLDPIVSPSVDILMTQAEEENLPLPLSMKAKRKKESSKDPNRASFSDSVFWLEVCYWFKFRTGNWLVSVYWLVSRQDWFVSGLDSADLVHWLVSGVSGSGLQIG